MINRSESLNLKYTLIDSRRFFIKRICGYIIAGVSILLGSMIFSRGASRNFLSRFMDIPYGVEVALYFVVFILLIIAISLIVNKEKNKGEMLFGSDMINLRGSEINLVNTPIAVSLNASKEKLIYERTIKDSGGNNWVEFVQKGEPKKCEFLIQSQKEEEELTWLIDEYWKKGFKVELKSSPPLFWEKLSELATKKWTIS